MNKKFSTEISARDKANFWVQAAERINSISMCQRTADEVTKKWIDTKSNAKKKAQNMKTEMRKTGGGPHPGCLTNLEEKVVTVIPKCSINGIVNAIDVSADANFKEGDVPSKANSNSGYFSPTTDWNSMKLYGKLNYLEEMRMLLVGSEPVQGASYILQGPAMEVNEPGTETEKKHQCLDRTSPRKDRKWKMKQQAVKGKLSSNLKKKKCAFSKN